MSKGKYTNLQKQEIGDRIKRRMDELKLRPKDLMEPCDISSGTASNWPNGISVPEGENLYNLAELLEVTWQYILRGELSKNVKSSSNRYGGIVTDTDFSLNEFTDGGVSNARANTEVEVPHFEDIETAAQASGDDSGGTLKWVSKSLLEEAGVIAENAFFVTIKGNSMEPKYESGGLAGFDNTATKIIDGQEYALNHDGLGRFKVLYKLPGGKVRLHSYNEAEYPDETVPLSELTILGQFFSYQRVKRTG